MKFKAELNHRNRYTVLKDCVIEKTIRLPGDDFDAFSADLLRAWGFIRENRGSMFVDDNNTHHCLLITGDGHRDGVLVNAEGRDFASYACHVPDAQAFLTARSPALTALGEKLSACVEHLAADHLSMLEKGERAAMYVFEEAQEYGVDAPCSATLRDTVIEMLGERLAGRYLDMEFDNGELILTPTPAMAEPELTLNL